MFACQESLVSKQAGLRAEMRREEKEKPAAKPGRKKRKESAGECAEAVAPVATKRSRAKKSQPDAEPAGGSAPDVLPKTVGKPAPRTRKGKGGEEKKKGEERKKDEEVAKKPKGPKGKGKGKGKSGDPPDIRKLKADKAYENLLGLVLIWRSPNLVIGSPSPCRLLDLTSQVLVWSSTVKAFTYRNVCPVKPRGLQAARAWRCRYSFAFCLYTFSFTFCMHMCVHANWFDLCMSSCVATIPMDRWTPKVVLQFLGILLMVKRWLCCAMHGARPKSWLVGKAWLTMFWHTYMLVYTHIYIYLVCACVCVCAQCICMMWPQTP